MFFYWYLFLLCSTDGHHAVLVLCQPHNHDDFFAVIKNYYIKWVLQLCKISSSILLHWFGACCSGHVIHVPGTLVLCRRALLHCCRARGCLCVAHQFRLWLLGWVHVCIVEEKDTHALTRTQQRHQSYSQQHSMVLPQILATHTFRWLRDALNLVRSAS